jgi:hypothetical protein
MLLAVLINSWIETIERAPGDLEDELERRRGIALVEFYAKTRKQFEVTKLKYLEQHKAGWI